MHTRLLDGMFCLLVSSKVTASKVAETGVNVQLLVQTSVNLGSDDLHGWELLNDGGDTLGAGDEVQEQDSLLGDTVVDQSLDSLDG